MSEFDFDEVYKALKPVFMQMESDIMRKLQCREDNFGQIADRQTSKKRLSFQREKKMSKDEDVKKFIELVIQMRKTQREFFRTRNYSLMQQSKVLEKEVDDMAGKLRKKLSEQEQMETPSLFAGEQ